MNKTIIIIALLALVVKVGQAQKHLPAFQHSKEPAVLNGSFTREASQKLDSVRTFLPVLGQDVLEYNDRLQHKLSAHLGAYQR